MNESEIWAASERLDLLFSLLPKRVQERRANSHLKALTSNFMDYLTRSDLVSDAEATAIGRAAFGVYRVTTSIETLYGRLIDSNITSHPLFREVERLFDNSKRSFDGAEFTLYSAAQIEIRAHEKVALVLERANEVSPDLRVSELCYVECKDLVPASAGGIRAAMHDRLQEAAAQLAAARRRDCALAGGVALDLPLQLFQPDAIDSCPAARDSRAIVAETLSVPGEIGFVILSISGFEITPKGVWAPDRLAVFARQNLPVAIFRRLLSRLASCIYVCPPDRQREHRIRERAFFHWENRSGRYWRDPVSNWIEAEEEDVIDPPDWVELASDDVARR
jgi:hypothetical protein